MTVKILSRKPKKKNPKTFLVSIPSCRCACELPCCRVARHLFTNFLLNADCAVQNDCDGAAIPPESTAVQLSISTAEPELNVEYARYETVFQRLSLCGR